MPEEAAVALEFCVGAFVEAIEFAVAFDAEDFFDLLTMLVATRQELKSRARLELHVVCLAMGLQHVRL